jgi:hypothetical protein
MRFSSKAQVAKLIQINRERREQSNLIDGGAHGNCI